MMRMTNAYLISAIACLGGMLFGMDISSMSGFIDLDPYKETFNYPDSLTQGGITSAMAGGSFLSSLIAGLVCDKIGRRYTIMTSCVLWVVGAAIQTSSSTQAQLIVGRLVAGFGVGFASTQVPVFIAELAPKNIRGRLVGGFQWAVTWGILIQYLISYGCSKVHSKAAFQIAWGIQMVPGVIMFVGMIFTPESPRWLAGKDRWEEAIEIISEVQGKGDVNNPQVLIEIEELKEQVRIDRESESVSLIDLFKKDSLNRTFVGIWGQIWQQLCGMNVMMYYIVYMFKMAGMGDASLTSSIIQYVLNMVMTIPALLWIDRWGRRTIFIAGGTSMAIWLWCVTAILAVYSYPVENPKPEDNITISVDNPNASKAVIACCYLFVCSFAPSWGPGMWLYCAEIFPLKQRAMGSAICGSMNWAFNFALGLFVPSAFHNITWKTYVIFALFCTVMTLHTFLLFPETKGKTLEEIEQIWQAKIPAWKTADFQVRQPSIADIRAVSDIPDDKHIADEKHEETV